MKLGDPTQRPPVGSAYTLDAGAVDRSPTLLNRDFGGPVPSAADNSFPKRSSGCDSIATRDRDQRKHGLRSAFGVHRSSMWRYQALLDEERRKEQDHLEAENQLLLANMERDKEAELKARRKATDTEKQRQKDEQSKTKVKKGGKKKKGPKVED